MSGEIRHDRLVELEGGRTHRPSRHGGQPVHLAEVVHRPSRQGRAEGQRRLDRDQPVVRPLHLVQGLIEAAQGPADVLDRRVAGDTEAGDGMRPGGRLVDRPHGAPGHVQEAAMVDPHHPQEAVDPADPEAGAVGQGRAEVRRPDRRQAQDPSRPGRVGEQLARVEPPHAVADDVHRLAREGRLDLLAQPSRTRLDPCDRRHARHHHPVAAGAEELGDAPEVGRKPQPTHADGANPKEPMGQHDRSLETHAHRRSLPQRVRRGPSEHRDARTRSSGRGPILGDLEEVVPYL